MTNFISASIIFWGIFSLALEAIGGEITFSQCLQSGSKITFNINLDGEPSRIISTDANIPENYTRLREKPIINPCEPNPCLHGSSCKQATDQMDYRCTNCPYPMRGKHCGDFICTTTCFRLNSTVFYLHPDKTSSWEDAYDKCIKRGMTLAMIKDEFTHNFLRRSLVDLYVDRVDVYHAYWIGLNRSSKSSPWTWVDGSPLGQYTAGWSQYSSHDHNCACVENKLWDNFKFTDNECSQGLLYDYFPLCQNTYPHLFRQDDKNDPCQPNPCFYGGTCQVNSDHDDYHCTNCPYPMGGKNCAALSCNNTCHRWGETVFFEFRPSSNWEDARDICTTNGMTMATIKDENTHRFLKSNLPTHYDGQTHLAHCYWIGLSRSSANDSWTWMDGSKLGFYHDWAKHHSSKISLCSAICNYKGFKLGEDDCSLSKDVYPLCQKKYHFLRNSRIHLQRSP